MPRQRSVAAFAEYQPPPLDEGIDEALLDFIGRRKGAVEDAGH
jgi:trimethylamine--corrinoid protein Co-methyltransferase